MIFCRGLALPTIRLHGLYTQAGIFKRQSK